MNNFQSQASQITEARIIPELARVKGLTHCFVYAGPSMRPTFRDGHLLYVRPTAQDITAGDVIVFDDPVKGHVVHRVVSVTSAGFITRGDNNPCDDPHVVQPEWMVGRVEMVEDKRLKPVAGGALGLWLMHIEKQARRTGNQLLYILGAPYRMLRGSPTIRRVLYKLFARHLDILCLKTPDGFFFKALHRGKVVARLSPGQAHPEIQRPYDLFLDINCFIVRRLDNNSNTQKINCEPLAIETSKTI